MRHFQTLLEGIIANPDQSIQTLPLHTEAERRQILEEGNTTDAEIPRQHSIHRLFEIQTTRRPTATAVVYDGNGLSYAGLIR